MVHTTGPENLKKLGYRAGIIAAKFVEAYRKDPKNQQCVSTS